MIGLRIPYFIVANFIIAIYYLPIFIINVVLIFLRNVFLLLLLPISYIALILYGIVGFFLSAFGGYERLVKPAFLEFYKWQVYAVKKLSLTNVLKYPKFMSPDELKEIEKKL